MSLCKFTLGVAAGLAAALLYDTYKKGKLCCCCESCGCGCGGEEDERGEIYAENGKQAVKQAADKAAEIGEEIKHGAESRLAEPLGDLAGR